MRYRLARSIRLFVGATLSFTLLPLSLSANDIFHDQILLPTGGTIIMFVQESQGFNGSITFAASNIPSDTAVSIPGFAEAIPGVNRPPGVSAVLFWILINFEPPRPSVFTTSGVSTVSLALPSTVDKTKPVSLFQTEVDRKAFVPDHFAWSAPLAGSVSAAVLTFSLPAQTFHGDRTLILAVTE